MLVSGTLRYIRSLKPWPLKRVMMEKYLYTDRDATLLCDFLEPMLVVDMKQRSHARGYGRPPVVRRCRG